jgi:hypothetical protein
MAWYYWLLIAYCIWLMTFPILSEIMFKKPMSSDPDKEVLLWSWLFPPFFLLGLWMIVFLLWVPAKVFHRKME